RTRCVRGHRSGCGMPQRRAPAAGKPPERWHVRRRGGREKTWPCGQSTQNLSKPELRGLDSVQAFGGRPTGLRPVGRVLGLPTARFAGAALAVLGGLPTGRFAGAAAAVLGGLPTGRLGGAAGAGAIAARMVRSVSSSRAARARTRLRAARVAASASASETGAPPARFC